MQGAGCTGVRIIDMVSAELEQILMAELHKCYILSEVKQRCKRMSAEDCGRDFLE